MEVPKVNNTDHTIAIAGHGLKTDDQIQYFTNGGIAIGGLTDQEKYYVLVKDQDKIQLAKALGLELDNSGVAANSQQGFSKRDSKEFNIKTDVDFNTNQIKGLPKNKLFQEKQETGFLKNDNHFKGGEKGLPRATPFLPLIYA